jgi:hypothetical protein
MDAADSEADEKESLEAYKQINDNSDFNGKNSESFGTLGDLLKSKLDKKNK